MLPRQQVLVLIRIAIFPCCRGGVRYGWRWRYRRCRCFHRCCCCCIDVEEPCPCNPNRKERHPTAVVTAKTSQPRDVRQSKATIGNYERKREAVRPGARQKKLRLEADESHETNRIEVRPEQAKRVTNGREPGGMEGQLPGRGGKRKTQAEARHRKGAGR